MSQLSPVLAKKAKALGVEIQHDEHTNHSFVDWEGHRLVSPFPKELVTGIEALIVIKNTFKSFKWTVNKDQRTITLTCKKPEMKIEGHPAEALRIAKKEWEEYRKSADEDELEEEDAAIEDEEPSGSVVGMEYRARYAEAGHPAHCGDFLAVALNNQILNKGGANMELLEQICKLNHVDTSKYNKTNKGWQGRLRMTARNMLARIVFYNGGNLILPNERVIRMPKDWMDAQRFKGGAPANLPVVPAEEAPAPVTPAPKPRRVKVKA